MDQSDLRQRTKLFPPNTSHLCRAFRCALKMKTTLVFSIAAAMLQSSNVATALQLDLNSTGTNPTSYGYTQFLNLILYSIHQVCRKYHCV